MSPLILQCLVLAAVVAIGGGCASVSVDDFHRHARPVEKPQAILVAPFEISAGALKVDRVDGELENFREALRASLSRELRDRISRHVAPARPLAAGSPPPQGPYWLVTGRFVRVHQGSRFLRSVIGLGAGGTKMETSVNVYDLSGPEPIRIMSFETTGGSNISPGIGGVVTVPMSGPMALTSLFNVFEGVVSGVTFDTVRTSREITATLSESFAEAGWTEKSRALKPKTPGEYTLPWEAVFKNRAD